MMVAVKCGNCRAVNPDDAKFCSRCGSAVQAARKEHNTMKCPSCTSDLRITDRSGIEIDYCPSCRGVWLDRGELDKIIERAATQTRGGFGDDDDDDDDRYRGRQAPPLPPRGDGYSHPQSGYGQHGYPKKKKSWLGELLDFD